MNQKIITIKIGTSVSLTSRGVLDEYRLGHLAIQIGQLQRAGQGVVLVASGAIACGHRVNKNLDRTSAAGVGQAILTSTFLEVFKQHGLQLAQILVRSEDLTFELVKTVRSLLAAGIVPLFNENDAINITSDFAQGNDFLAVELARRIGSQRLYILSTMQDSNFGVGGGEAKLQAVAKARIAGIETQILDGKAENILLKNIC